MGQNLTAYERWQTYEHQCSEANVLTKNDVPAVRGLRKENCEENNVINVRGGKGNGSSY